MPVARPGCESSVCCSATGLASGAFGNVEGPLPGARCGGGGGVVRRDRKLPVVLRSSSSSGRIVPPAAVAPVLAVGHRPAHPSPRLRFQSLAARWVRASSAIVKYCKKLWRHHRPLPPSCPRRIQRFARRDTSDDPLLQRRELATGLLLAVLQPHEPLALDRRSGPNPGSVMAPAPSSARACCCPLTGVASPVAAAGRPPAATGDIRWRARLEPES